MITHQLIINLDHIERNALKCCGVRDLKGGVEGNEILKMGLVEEAETCNALKDGEFFRKLGGGGKTLLAGFA